MLRRQSFAAYTIPECFGRKQFLRSLGFFWVLGGIPDPSQDAEFEFYVIPASVMSLETKAMHQRWLDTPGKDGELHKDTTFRTTFIPPASNQYSWDASPYKNAWHLIEEKLAD